MMRWGLIPPLPKAPPVGPPRHCVDLDEIHDSPIFRAPWLNSQRCILPIAGFYVWQLTNTRYRQPFFVCLIDRSIIGLAAVWDRYVSEDDDVIESCSIICVPPNDLMMKVANTDGRMPAILRRRDYQTWLRGTPVEAKAALRPYEQSRMQAHPVSPRINSTAPDDPSLIHPVGLMHS